ncbi:MAG: hypothetical protein ACRC5A_10415 [Enterobacteriaceae bacterium]
MKLKQFALSVSLLGVLFLGGCASVALESSQESTIAKRFQPPEANKSGLYIYRDSFIGKALKKDIYTRTL